MRMKGVEVWSYQYSASLKFWYVRPCNLRYSRIVELMDAVELALLSLQNGISGP
jgi:hypothetical protein